MRTLIRTSCFILLVAPGGDAGAVAPSQALNVQITRAMEVLKDPALKGDEQSAKRRAAIRRIADDTFDFEEMARRTLARHWLPRTPAERTAFVRLFADLLERAYFSRIDAYGGETVQYLGDEVEGDRATVHTKIVTQRGAEVPVDYRMLRREGRWLVYDVIVEGVSLVANYRNQFNRVIQIESYESLVRKMEAKASELEAGQPPIHR